MSDLTRDIDELPPGDVHRLAALAVRPATAECEAAPLPGGDPRNHHNHTCEDSMNQASCSPAPAPFGGPPTRGIIPDEPPPFPVGALPSQLAAWVAEMASVNAVRPDVPGVLALGALSCVAAWVPKDEPPMRVEDGAMSEPLNLYCVAVEESGSNKSGILGPAVAPLREIAAELVAAALPEQAKCKADREVHQLAVDELREQLKRAMRAGKGNTSSSTARSRDELAAELQDAQLTLATLPTPPDPSLIESDTTPEALAVAVAENPAICLATSEGHEIFASITGRTGNGPNMDLMLKGWDGESTSVRRKSAPRMEIHRPTIAWCVAVQPVTVRNLGKFDGDLNERGLVGRILWGCPDTVIGTRSPPSGERLSASTVAGYRATVRRLFELRAAHDADGSGRPMRLSPEARELFAGFYVETERRMADGGDLAWCRSMASKMRSQVLRFAGLLHLAGGGDPGGIVTASTARDALDLGGYFLAMGLRAWRAMLGRDEEPAERLWRVLKSRAVDTGIPYTDPQNQGEPSDSVDLCTLRGVTERDLWQSVRRSFGSMDEMRSVLAELKRTGYVAHIDQQAEGPGRPGSPWVVLNPFA